MINDPKWLIVASKAYSSRCQSLCLSCIELTFWNFSLTPLPLQRSAMVSNGKKTSYLKQKKPLTRRVLEWIFQCISLVSFAHVPLKLAHQIRSARPSNSHPRVKPKEANDQNGRRCIFICVDVTCASDIPLHIASLHYRHPKRHWTTAQVASA